MSAEPNASKPAFITELEQAYGGPSQAAFGSAVFFESIEDPESAPPLAERALKIHQHFCGDTWERFGPENWHQNWKLVFNRNTTSSGSIVAELGSLEDFIARQSSSMLLENEGDEAHTILVNAFDSAQVSEMSVFKMGDGGAMSGLLLAARRTEGDLFLAFLMD